MSAHQMLTNISGKVSGWSSSIQYIVDPKIREKDMSTMTSSANSLQLSFRESFSTFIPGLDSTNRRTRMTLNPCRIPMTTNKSSITGSSINSAPWRSRYTTKNTDIPASNSKTFWILQTKLFFWWVIANFNISSSKRSTFVNCSNADLIGSLVVVFKTRYLWFTSTSSKVRL